MTGMWPNSQNVYNSYSLQAESWLNGRLDLGQNYSHLELAIFEGKYYVSFPPLPSIILLPFVAIMGTATPDHLISGLALITGGIFAYKCARQLHWNGRNSVFAALFVTVGGNLVFVGFSGWVWFIAQSLSYCFTMGSFYFALTKGKIAHVLSLLFLCIASGCRPFQLIYAPVILYLLWRGSLESFKSWLARFWICTLPAIALGCVYIALNFARFGSVLEFGHNYLPEFTDAQHGQFNTQYLLQNLQSLVRFPFMGEKGMSFPQFDGFNIFISSPLFLAVIIAAFTGKRKFDPYAVVLSAVCVVLHLIALCSHKTMGGWQFGHRYPADALPAVFIAYLLMRKRPSMADWPLALFGYGLNLAGTVVAFKLY